MTAREHLARAIELAELADERLAAAMSDDAPLPLPERLAALQEARTAAEVARTFLDLHRELALMEHFPDLVPPLGVAAPVYDLPARADMRATPEIGDTKDCEHCGMGLAYMPGKRGSCWQEIYSSVPHTCPPPDGKKAPAAATAEAQPAPSHKKGQT